MGPAGIAAVFVFNLLCLSLLGSAQNYEIPRLPGAELLEASYLPYRHLLATEDKTITLPKELTDAFLSISADGSIIGCVRRIPGSGSSDERRIVSTYSVKDEKLTDYLEITGFWGSSAIAPDGTEMAYVTSDPLPDSFGVHLSLRLLDFKTGKVRSFNNPSGSVEEISWSPDSRRIAFDMGSPRDRGVDFYRSEIRTINMIDVESGKISSIGVGGTPSWSPSGEWIAYVGYVPTNRADAQQWSFYNGRYYANDDFELRLTNTAGTHSRRLMRLHSGPNFKPVWSPDSQTILFNEMRDPDRGMIDIYMLDVVTGKRTKKFKNVGPVFAWVAAK
jgi:Tol biopolymer transport system component